MDVTSASPRVLRHGWGHIEVERVGTWRDAKLWPGGGRAWDWDETGTRHRPGIQPADVSELLKEQPDVIVLSRGRQLRLETCQDTIELLEARGIFVVRDETGAAIAEYNRLVDARERVAALIHTTC